MIEPANLKARVRQVAEQNMGTLHAGDIEAFSQLYTADAEITLPNGEVVRGPDGARDFMSSPLGQRLARSKRQVDHEHMDGSTVTVQGVVTDPGDEAASREPMSARFFEVFVLDGTFIREHRLYIGDDYAGTPPWEIGAAQPDFIALGQSGRIAGALLDVGCGSGENALYFAMLGLDVVGIDASRLAIEKARAKAAQRQLDVRFVVADATAPPFPARTFDASIDSGLFHILSEHDQAALVASLHRVLRAGARHHLMCLSEHATISGPRPSTRDYIRRMFAAGWLVESIRAARFVLNGADGCTTDKAAAWLATIQRL